MDTVTVDYALLLSASFPEVSPHAFYRDLFPAGSLQASRPGKKGEYPAIAVQIREGGNLRHTVLDDLAVVDELCATDDFCVMSPVTYAGASQRKSMAHALHAVVIDLDGLKARDNGHEANRTGEREEGDYWFDPARKIKAEAEQRK